MAAVGRDTPAETGGDLRRTLRELQPGTEVTLTVARSSGERRIRVRLSEAPSM